MIGKHQGGAGLAAGLLYRGLGAVDLQIEHVTHRECPKLIPVIQGHVHTMPAQKGMLWRGGLLNYKTIDHALVTRDVRFERIETRLVQPLLRPGG